jgi:dTDP-4-amino-4,6-dideoxygalactose transaminase
MEGLQGAVLGVKIKYIEEWNEKRRKNAQSYNNLLEKFKVVRPFEADYAKHVYHIYAIRVKKRDELRSFLDEKGISTGIHYPIPLHLQKAYQFMGLKEGSFTISEKIADEIISLPMFPELTEEQMHYIAGCIEEFLKQQNSTYPK